MLKRLVKISAGVALAAMLSSAAFAEVVSTAATSADPRIARSAQDVDRLRGAYPARPVRGPGHPGRQGRPDPGRRRKLDRLRRRQGLHLQDARRTPNGRTAIRSPPTISSSPSGGCRIPTTAAEYAYMLYVVKNAEAINTGQGEAGGARRQGDRRQTLEVTLNAPTPYFLEMLTHQATYPVHKAIDREARRRFDQARQSRLERRLHARRVRAERSHQGRQESEFYDAANVKIDVVNFYPDRGPLDRDEALRGGRARLQRRHADRAARRPPGEVRRPGPGRPLSRHLLLRLQARQGAVEQRRSSASAISMAIDRDFLAEKVWANTMIPAYGLVPPGIGGYDAGRRPTMPRCRSSTARTRRRRS